MNKGYETNLPASTGFLLTLPLYGVARLLLPVVWPAINAIVAAILAHAIQQRPARSAREPDNSPPSSCQIKKVDVVPERLVIWIASDLVFAIARAAIGQR